MDGAPNQVAVPRTPTSHSERYLRSALRTRRKIAPLAFGPSIKIAGFANSVRECSAIK